VFDPMDGSVLEINVCDACLLRAAKLGRVIHTEPAKLQPTDTFTKPNKRTDRTIYWNGGDY
jgi:hypothetical protein